MTKPSVRTPSYRRHKSSGQAVVTIAGRDHYLGKHGTAASHEAYRRLVAEWLQTGQVSLNDPCHSVTVAEVMAAFIGHARDYYRKNGKPTREYELIVECCRFIKPLYGRAPASDFGPLALKAVRSRMIKAGHCRKHINKNVDRIKRMFRWAAAEEIIPATIPQALSMVSGLRAGRTEAPEHPPVQPVPDEVIDATLEHLPAVVADLVRLQRVTAMRPSEACNLRPCDLDRSQDVWVYRPTEHKTMHQGRDRVVLIGPKGQSVLLRYLARDPSAYCFRPSDSEQKRRAAAHTARVIPIGQGNQPDSNRKRRPKRSAGEHYTVDSYRRAIHRACEKGGVERWSPNRLRHTAATEFRARFGLEAAQLILGHAKADVTQVYAARDHAKAIEAAKLIG